jgi:ABC-type molybdate transport system substrate-binding protein
MNIFKSKPALLDDYDKERLEEIKKKGGFVDFGAVGSMPYGCYADKTLMSTRAYYSARKLIAAKKLKKSEKVTNEQYPFYLTNRIVTGELYK